MTPFGALLRNVRQGLGLSLKEHAQRVGVTPAYLSALEHGHRGVATPEMLDRITSTLGVDEELTRKLKKLNEVSRPDVTIRTGGLQPKATELANLLARNIQHLSEDELSGFVDLLRQKGDRPACSG